MRNNNCGVMSFTLSQLALIVATAILLTTVFLFVYYNDWGRNADMQGVASRFTTVVEGMDGRFFENTTVFWFPDKNYDYSVYLSHEYVVVESEGSWSDGLREVRRFNLRPWITIGNLKWVSGSELHDFLELNYVNRGTEMDPLVGIVLYDSIIGEFNHYTDIANVSFAKDPYLVDLREPVYVEKVYLYFDVDGNSGWDKDSDERYCMIIVYQK